MNREQNEARQIITDLIESGLTIREVAKAVSINKSSLADFYKGIGVDLTPAEIGKLENVSMGR
jgi:hypothetical protein